jgi:hypothetical protein
MRSMVARHVVSSPAYDFPRPSITGWHPSRRAIGNSSFRSFAAVASRSATNDQNGWRADVRRHESPLPWGRAIFSLWLLPTILWHGNGSRLILIEVSEREMNARY